ncbi:MAG: hypothetical protein HN580_03240 [Deltaproteobacteria bacterium]|jgi:hypothetical protein|nr:hypothetical protein [Deltaproteobacteria bacterium]MBT4090688.1 hypothetical protein [Deltaproteobacteria bacterium]MBT4262732.1 hypothetical protein [Deltaproteobacteria bacterium]MBT4639544.1 hypothetical protein [Deltaproteobacteria bacterium]MBT6616226.1 hypothetical protein [Deltaproteobacteria bacterium]
MKNFETTYKKLHTIYDKYRRMHKENPDSKQMCCMWSTNDPPDIIDDTDPFLEIEDAFEINIDEDSALDLYDMELEEAAKKIIEIQIVQP